MGEYTLQAMEAQAHQQVRSDQTDSGVKLPLTGLLPSHDDNPLQPLPAQFHLPKVKEILRDQQLFFPVSAFLVLVDTRMRGIRLACLVGHHDHRATSWFRVIPRSIVFGLVFPT